MATKKKAPLGSGARFAALAGAVAKDEMKAGKPVNVAKDIGAATAAKIGREKYGAKRFAEMAAAGRKGKVMSKSSGMKMPKKRLQDMC